MLTHPHILDALCVLTLVNIDQTVANSVGQDTFLLHLKTSLTHVNNLLKMPGMLIFVETGRDLPNNLYAAMYTELELPGGATCDFGYMYSDRATATNWVGLVYIHVHHMCFLLSALYLSCEEPHLTPHHLATYFASCVLHTIVE